MTCGRDPNDRIDMTLRATRAICLGIIWIGVGILNYQAVDCHKRTEWPWAVEGRSGPGADWVDTSISFIGGPLATLGAVSILGDKCAFLP
jgi:hypothetical protein